jgi:hypothetical protein
MTVAIGLLGGGFVLFRRRRIGSSAVQGESSHLLSISTRAVELRNIEEVHKIRTRLSWIVLLVASLVSLSVIPTSGFPLDLDRFGFRPCASVRYDRFYRTFAPLNARMDFQLLHLFHFLLHPPRATKELKKATTRKEVFSRDNRRKDATVLVEGCDSHLGHLDNGGTLRNPVRQ